jgi:hypothetical protein
MKLIKELTEEVEFVLEEVGGKKNYFIEGNFIQANLKNRNGRYYPKENIQEEVNRYITERITPRNAFGELGHPAGPTINLDRVSHMIVSLTENGDNWVGKAKLLDTPMGKIAKSLLDEGAKLGVSSRGLGTVKSGQVQKDFKLATPADIVADPSAPDAFVHGIMEGKEWILENGVWSERQVDEAYDLISETPSRDLAKVRVELFESFINSL